MYASWFYCNGFLNQFMVKSCLLFLSKHISKRINNNWLQTLNSRILGVSHDISYWKHKTKMIIRYAICFGMLCSTIVSKTSNAQYSNRQEPVVSRLEQSSPNSELLLGNVNNNQTIGGNEFGRQNSLNEHELKKIQNLITIRRQNTRRR